MSESLLLVVLVHCYRSKKVDEDHDQQDHELLL